MSMKSLLRIVLLLFAVCVPVVSDAADTRGAKPLKNVIMLIPDGASISAMTLTRWVKGAPLSMDPFACGLVRTYSSDSPIADSAPAATAFATGFKSHSGYIGIRPEKSDMPGLKATLASEAKRPQANVAEAAHLAGKSVGIVATSEIMHATPAAFSSHTESRKDYDAIFEQQIHSGFDVFLGGGAKMLDANGRRDKEDMAKAAREQGFSLVRTPSELAEFKTGRLLGLFAPAAMSCDFDRASFSEPSLAEMTSKAIEILSANPKGFFLMVEGSQVDWAAHANSPAGVVSEMLAFEAAAKVALDFAMRDGSTAVIICSDHGTGGITFGDRGLKDYSRSRIEDFTGCLSKAKRTEKGAAVALKKGMDKEAVRESLKNSLGIEDLSETEIQTVVKSLKNSKKGLGQALSGILSSRSHIGWTTGGHTGEEVALFCFVPEGARPMGVIENSDVATWMAAWLGVDLDSATHTLICDGRGLLESKGATVSEDASNPANPMLIATIDGRSIAFPVNRSYAIVEGGRVPIGGVAIRIGSKWHLPSHAADLLK